LLAEARLAADRGDLKLADELCIRHLESHGPDANALTLLGVVRATRGHAVEAERDFTQALYLDPGHYDALLQMFALAQGRGDAAAVSNYRRRIDQAGRREGRS